ncbi:hypothetical protein BH23BAC4_BH23BAC4_11260 [soil metagenome]
MIWLLLIDLALLLVLAVLVAILVRRERSAAATAQQVERLRRRVGAFGARLDSLTNSTTFLPDDLPTEVSPAHDEVSRAHDEASGDGQAASEPPTPALAPRRLRRRRETPRPIGGAPST